MRDLTEGALFTFHESDVVGLEGVSVPNKDTPDWWLRVARLREKPPPQPDGVYLLWLLPLRPGADPFVRPTLVSELMVSLPIEEASDLIEAGLALADDAMRPKGEAAESVGRVDLLLRLENLTEFGGAFAEWVDSSWAEWERAERPRRKSIAFYNRLFEIQQRMSSMGDDVPIETVVGVGLARWDRPEGRVNAPLVEALVELELDPDDGTMEVRPRTQAPRLTLRAFDHLELPAVGKLQKDAAAALHRAVDDPDVGFSPHDPEGFKSVLRMCQSRLSADAVYTPDERGETDRSLGPIDRTLRITDTWVLYVRQRSSNFRCDDITRLKEAIEQIEESDLPRPAQQITRKPDDKLLAGEKFDLTHVALDGIERPPFAGGASMEPETEEQPFFFPLPCNAEQVEIARRLEHPDASGITVQGPPGTGKTHTIANIISHYMATGRRVLVSARSPEALSAVQGKLPESIRDLAISVIHSDTEGARRLEQAVRILAAQIKQIDAKDYRQRQQQLDAELVRVRKDLAETDERITEYAKMNVREVAFRGEGLKPMDLAAKVAAERADHAWFKDKLDLPPRFDPLFGDRHVAEARHIRKELGDDLAYGLDEFPNPAALPVVAKLLSAHAVLADEDKAASMTSAGQLPFVSIGPDSVGHARLLRSWLDEAANWREGLGSEDGWLIDAYGLLVGAKHAHPSLRDTLRSLLVEWVGLADQGREYVQRGVHVPDAGPAQEAFEKAISQMAAGQKAFGLFSFGSTATKVKACIAEVQVDGAAPGGREAWGCICGYLDWRRRGRGFLGRWSTVAATASLPHTFGEWPEASARLIGYGEPIGRMDRLHRVADDHCGAVAALFPWGVNANRVVQHLEISPTREALAAALDKEGHAGAHALLGGLEAIGKLAGRPFHSSVADVAQALGKPELDPRKLAEGWQGLLEEANRLHSLQPQRQRLETIAANVRESGAPLWAQALLTEPAAGDDPWTPETWAASWEWARADGHVRKLSDREAFAKLTEQHAELEVRQRQVMEELVRVRTFLGLKQGVTAKIAAALQMFAMKVQQLGAGTGKAAARHRRAIRGATLDAAGAVPCWILPEWRVAEQLPSELGVFDLVIVDEASQSDITCIPTILRGKKLLVVGDDKQVSPSAVGMDDKTVIQLRETYLRGMEAAKFLEPTTSLYDIASICFPGGVLTLREHFRCVEPIIAFSSRFYPEKLIPLRVPSATERINPPLVDVYLPNGRRSRDINEAEADYIVQEMKTLLDQPSYASRTFGVISLIGDKQAKLIQARLVAELGTEAITCHRIMCGNASTFQGQERDVMFLSMVACPNTVRSQVTHLIEQRINVAMSRARDRMYLVRSVAASMLQPKDLKLAVIEHFADPMKDARASLDHQVLEDTESPFEREVGAMLLGRGYRIRPQVRVGTFRIDFVVEGDGDRRLAVELDGDRYHGPDRWHEDILRQRSLERVGWTFWRCWGSHWFADKQGCFNDLLTTLDQMGITPVGMAQMSAHEYVEHRVGGAERGLGESAQTAVAESGHPVLATVNAAAPTLSSAMTSAPSMTSNEDIIEVGDTVTIRYDDNRVRSYELTRGANILEAGKLSVKQPLAEALLGKGIEDEIELVVDDKSQRVVIEKIRKAA